MTQIIGIDLHKTIDSNPELFQKFCMLRRLEHKLIYIISGPPEIQVENSLYELYFKFNIHYDRIISVVDWLKAQDTKMWQNDIGNWYADEKIWWSSKAAICYQYGVDYLIDDKEQYYEYFDITLPGSVVNLSHPTEFIHWKGDKKVLNF